MRDLRRDPSLDLRVDEHPDPLAELRRICDIVKEDLLPRG